MIITTKNEKDMKKKLKILGKQPNKINMYLLYVYMFIIFLSSIQKYNNNIISI